MIWVIARNEFLKKFRESGFTVILLLSFCVALLSIGLGISNYTRLHGASQQASSSATDNDLFDRLGQRRVQISRPPEPLSIFNTGMDNILSRHFTVKAGHFVHFANEIESGDAVVNIGELFNTFGSFDFGTVIQLFFSLSALLLGYNLISGERESGMLRLMLSNAVPRSSVILGKLIGSGLSIVLPFLIAFVSGLILVVGVGKVALNGEDGIRLGLFFLMSVLYLLCFLHLGAVSSALARASSTSLVVSLLLWAILVFVLPNLSTMMADVLSPVPSFSELVARKTMKMEAMIMGKDRSDEQTWIQVEQEVSQALQREDEWYQSRLDRQLLVAQVVSRISPLSCYVFSANALTRTGWEDQMRFMTAVERVRQAMRNQPSDEGHVSSLARTAMTLQDSIASLLMNGLLLILYTLIFFMVIYIRFLRCDIT